MAVNSANGDIVRLSGLAKSFTMSKSLISKFDMGLSRVSLEKAIVSRLPNWVTETNKLASLFTERCDFVPFCAYVGTILPTLGAHLSFLLSASGRFLGPYYNESDSKEVFAPFSDGVTFCFNPVKSTGGRSKGLWLLQGFLRTNKVDSSVQLTFDSETGYVTLYTIHDEFKVPFYAYYLFVRSLFTNTSVIDYAKVNWSKKVSGEVNIQGYMLDDLGADGVYFPAIIENLPVPSHGDLLIGDVQEIKENSLDSGEAAGFDVMINWQIVSDFRRLLENESLDILRVRTDEYNQELLRIFSRAVGSDFKKISVELSSLNVMRTSSKNGQVEASSSVPASSAHNFISTVGSAFKSLIGYDTIKSWIGAAGKSGYRFSSSRNFNDDGSFAAYQPNLRFIVSLS